LVSHAYQAFYSPLVILLKIVLLTVW
jgi:hypothetical protein